MQFRTQIPISKSDRPIGYDSKVVSLGSCFAVNMAQKFEYFQFRNSFNPFGILFHPIAIERFVHFAANQKRFDASDIFLHNERWHCFDAHSDLSGPNPQAVVDRLNAAISETHVALSNATHIIITYGTAWVYRECKTGDLVANCHKVAQSRFAKEILGVDTIAESIKNTIGMIRQCNPDVRIIFTISPVRHLKDGFAENQRSKSNLISALQQVLHTDGLQNNAYFPSYEIIMDELRDYRFYADDLIHPSPMATDYIWERFAQTQLVESALPTMAKIDQLRKGLAHRAFNPDSDSHKKFRKQLEEMIVALEGQFPHMRFQ